MRSVGSVKDMHAYAGTFIDTLASDIDGATVVGLSGDLGSGKTTFVQGVAHALGITQRVTSPTFVILKRYKTTDDKFTTLIHIDAYRLEESAELISLGWEEILKEKDTLVLIEWPENVKSVVPDDARGFTFTYVDTQIRNVD